MTQKTENSSSKVYQSQSMMRVDLSGGSLDIWPLYLMIDNCVTVQFSLKKYSQVHLKINPCSPEIQIHKTDSSEQQPVWTFPSITDFLKNQNPQLSLIQAFVQYFQNRIDFGFQLKFSSQSPIGGGLGGSSSLVVSLLKSFSKAVHTEFNFTDSLCLCRDLEARVLKMPTGLQDYIIPLQSHTYPWINIIELHPLKPKIQTIPLPTEVFKNLILIDSQISHHSGQTNWHIVQDALNGKTLHLLKQCRDISLEMAQACKKGQFDYWPQLFKKEYSIRKQLQPNSPKKLEELMQYLFSKEAQGIKMMGAGNGGCLLVWTPQKEKLLQTCHQENINVLDDFQSY